MLFVSPLAAFVMIASHTMATAAYAETPLPSAYAATEASRIHAGSCLILDIPRSGFGSQASPGPFGGETRDPIGSCHDFITKLGDWRPSASAERLSPYGSLRMALLPNKDSWGSEASF